MSWRTNNNFNVSDSGINIEVCIQLDPESSSRNFDENFIKIEHGRFKGYWLYIDWGNLLYLDGKWKNRFDKYFEPDLVLNNDREDRVRMMRYITQNGYYTSYSDVKNMDTQEMLEYWGDMNSEETREFLDEVGIEWEYEFDVIETSTRGYCQGDYEDVLIVPEAIRECWGTPDDIKDEDLLDSEYIDNLFWDSPMTCRVEVNGEEIYIEEFDGQYQQWRKDKNGKQYYWGYEKEVFIDYVVDHFKDDESMDLEVLRKELESVVPCEMEYPSWC
jgi:hypothetical protein